MLTLLFSSLFAFGHCHPSAWTNQVIKDSGVNPKCEDANNVNFYSFHIHILFTQLNNDSGFLFHFITPPPITLFRFILYFFFVQKNAKKINAKNINQRTCVYVCLLRTVTAALALKDKFAQAFNINDSIPCDGDNSTHNENPPVCFADLDYPNPTCPFTTSYKKKEPIFLIAIFRFCFFFPSFMLFFCIFTNLYEKIQIKQTIYD